jgi:hypothetical protein
MMAYRVEEIPRGITLRSVGLSASYRQMNRFGCSMNGAAELIHAEERSKQFCPWSSREITRLIDISLNTSMVRLLLQLTVAR